MSGYSTKDVQPAELLTMACNVLHRHFVAASRVDAKRRYTELNAQRPLPLVKIAMPDKSELLVYAKLDSSEYHGRLNFSTFRKQLEALLQHLARRVQEGGDVNLFNDESGSHFLFNLPLMIPEGDKFNALLLGVDLSVRGQATLEILYFDGEQYRAKDSADAR